jgi:hypothetical protein
LGLLPIKDGFVSEAVTIFGEPCSGIHPIFAILHNNEGVLLELPGTDWLLPILIISI